MKNFITFLMVVVFTATHSYAQENVSIGPIAGVSIANFHGVGPDFRNSVDWKPGLTIGGFYNHSAKSGFGFSGQLLFTQLGAQVSDKTNEINLNYIQVPLFATFFFGKYGAKFHPKVFAGPSANFLVGKKDKDGEKLVPDLYNSFDLGLTFGAGINIRLQQRIWLNLDARYGLGLLDTSSFGSKITNRNWGINAGVSFPLGTFDKSTGRLRTR